MQHLRKVVRRLPNVRALSRKRPVRLDGAELAGPQDLELDCERSERKPERSLPFPSFLLFSLSFLAAP